MAVLLFCHCPGLGAAAGVRCLSRCTSAALPAADLGDPAEDSRYAGVGGGDLRRQAADDEEQGVKALGVGVVFSFLGTMLSIVALVFIAPTLAKIALSFGPHDASV